MRSAEPRPLSEAREQQARALVARGANGVADSVAALEMLGEALASLAAARRKYSALRSALHVVIVEIRGRLYYRDATLEPLVPVPDLIRDAIARALAGVRRPGVRRNGPRSRVSR